MKYITEYPVPLTAYSKEEAPYVYTKKGEAVAKARAHLEPRTAGTIACFAGQPLQRGTTASAWLSAGYVEERRE